MTDDLIERAQAAAWAKFPAPVGMILAETLESPARFEVFKRGLADTILKFDGEPDLPPGFFVAKDGHGDTCQWSCQTPGARFHIEIKPMRVSCVVDAPFVLDLSDAEAAELERAVHDAMEAELAKYWRRGGVSAGDMAEGGE